MKYKIWNVSETFCCVCVHVCRCVVACMCTYIRRPPYILRQGLLNPQLADWASLASRPASGISSQVLGFQAGATSIERFHRCWLAELSGPHPCMDAPYLLSLPLALTVTLWLCIESANLLGISVAWNNWKAVSVFYRVRTCSSFISVIILKYPGKMHLKEGKVCFSLQFKVTVHHRGKSRQKYTQPVTTHAESRTERNGWTCSALLACLLLTKLSSLLHSSGPSLGNVLPTVCWVSEQLREIPYRHAFRPA